MAGNKYRTLVSGQETLKPATIVSTGVSNANEIVALDSTGKLDLSVLPTGIGPDIKVIVATEALSAGDYVNIYDATGAKCRKADNSNGRPAHGFVLSAVLSSGNATVYFEGANSALSGLTVGARQYLGTSGARTETPIAVAGLHQFLGVAISATEINTDIAEEVVVL